MDDTISRQAAIDAFMTSTSDGDKAEWCKWVLEQLPSAERRGRWIDKQFCSNYSGYDYAMKCSICGKLTYRQFAEKMPNYCGNCGALMVNENDNTD